VTEKEAAFRERLHSLYSATVVPAIYLNTDGSIFYANKVCLALYGTEFFERGFAPLVEGDWQSIVEKILNDMFPCEIRFKRGNLFVSGMLSPFKDGDGRIYLSVKTGMMSTPDQPLENTLLFDTAQSAFRSYVEDISDAVDIGIRDLCSIVGEDDPYCASMKDVFARIKEYNRPIKDVLYVIEKVSNADRVAFCLRDVVEDIARLTEAVRIIPSDMIGDPHIIIKGNPALITAAFTDIVTKLLPYSPSRRVCVAVTVENGQAAVRFNTTDPDARPEGRYVYTLDGDIYNENHESAYRLIKAEGGRMVNRSSPLGVDTVCLFPLETFSASYSLSTRNKITDHAVVVNAVRALKILRSRLKNK